MRLAADTGGTFTDLVVECGEDVRLYKSSTTPHDPAEGILAAVAQAAQDAGREIEDFLADAEVFIHGTTRAINAILTNSTARTALLSTRGHPDVLLLREGGRTQPFDWTHGYPEPYIPRALTFEIDERIGSQGEIVKPLDRDAAVQAIGDLAARGVESVAVCLLWSIANPAHELALGELLERHLPGVPYTLSHALNPTLREYRRASCAAIDASLKPLMTAYLRGLEDRLRASGFAGRLLMVTSSGGVVDAADMAAAPIHSINSGPAMAPIAGRHYASLDGLSENAVVADTGGTSYDVALVRRGRIPVTRETWLGLEYEGHITGFPAVDVRSVGAGGGSIAWIDPGGLLHVGPQSAGADPGPVCYGRGGVEPTVTDASVVLGYIDPEYFLGGKMSLDAAASERAIAERVGKPLGLATDEAAAAIMAVATERMIQSIEEITVNQGVDPRTAVLVGGGGAAGLNAVAIARRLGSPRIVIPQAGAVLSARGALMSDLMSEYAAAFFTGSEDFDHERAQELLGDLRGRCEEFARRSNAAAEPEIEYVAEARYRHQVWQLDVRLRQGSLGSPEDLTQLVEDFHAVHEEVYAVRDDRAELEVVNLRARVTCPLGGGVADTVAIERDDGALPSRRVFFSGVGEVDAAIWRLESMAPGAPVAGPAIVESSFTTIVLNPGASAERAASGSLVIVPDVAGQPDAHRLAGSSAVSAEGVS
ncbi:MAG TPA: hydantoinase/oxoprolinase family protein [Solirubrobacteraceae bacterium]|jgi:N-methylhydantoinase A|nr:hydantoinase/oxoprolinase family protein [Solirubrobacteraceae bacterium]